MAGDRELNQLRKDLQRNREEIAALQKRIQALIEKRTGAPAKRLGNKSSGEKPPRDKGPQP